MQTVTTIGSISPSRYSRSTALMPLAQAALLSVLVVTHLFHPVEGLPIKSLRNSNMSHWAGSRRDMPVLLAGRKLNHFAGAYFLFRAILNLRPAES